MKRLTVRLALAVWVVAATLALAQLWLARPDLGPQLPQPLALQLVELYGSSNGEQLRDLETLIALGSAFCVVLVVTLAGAYVRRRLGTWTGR